MRKRRLEEAGMQSTSKQDSEMTETQAEEVPAEKSPGKSEGISPLMSSARSSSTGSNWSAYSNGTMNYTHLRSRLTREQVNRDPMDFYEVTKTLGEGSMGSVKLVRKKSHKIGGSARRTLDRTESSDSQMSTATAGSNRPSKSRDLEYEMKSIVLSHVNNQSFIDELRNEIDILKTLDHPHIVRAIETFEFKQEICIVMELCDGGDLYSRDPYTEAEAAKITYSIVSALAYMHAKKVTHRDLKYENILFASPNPNSEIKLIDFGLSKKYANDHLTEGVGTIYTMAPEVMRGKYTEKADLWSVGVLAYILLSSMFPFYAKKKKDIARLVLRGQYRFYGPRWQRVSRPAMVFIYNLLMLDPSKRPDAETALKAPWFEERASLDTSIHTHREKLICESMTNYAGYSRIKKMALMVVAHKSNNDEIGDLKHLFEKYDTMQDGSISYQEFSEAMQSFDYTDEDLQTLFDSMDLDGTGRIRYTEFVAATIEAHGLISEERLAEAFDRLDSDDSGFISAQSLSEILGANISQEEIDEIIAEGDLPNDQQISYLDFLALWDQRLASTKDKYSTEHSLEVTEDTPTPEGVKILSMSDTREDDVAKETVTLARMEFLKQKFDSFRPPSSRW